MSKKKLIKKCQGGGYTAPLSVRPAGYNDTPQQIPEQFWYKLDNFANGTEKLLGVTGLGLMGATAAAPNPYTLGAAYVNSLASGAVDVYQMARALYNKDYQNVTKNSMDLLLSLVGAKLFKNAKNFKQADEALSQSGAPRKLVTRTIGRGRSRHKVTWPYEKARYNETIGPAYTLDTFGNAMNFMDVKTEDETE